jgi:hypothetical protein
MRGWTDWLKSNTTRLTASAVTSINISYMTYMINKNDLRRVTTMIHVVRLPTLLQLVKLIVNSMYPDQTAKMRRMVWIHAGRKRTMLVLSWSGSFHVNWGTCKLIVLVISDKLYLKLPAVTVDDIKYQTSNTSNNTKGRQSTHR